MRTMHGERWTYFAPEKGDGSAAGGGTGDAGAGAGIGAGGAPAAPAATSKGGAGAGTGAAAGGAPAADGKGAAGTDEGKAGDWAPDWRTKIAGDDPKALKQLERYSSPKDVWNKARAFEQRLSSGELRSTLPKDATAEQVTAWRAENGIPETPDKYELKLRDGLVIGKDDRPLVNEFLKSLHGANATNAQASAAVDWYYETQERMSAERAQKDADYVAKSADELRAEYGPEFRLNMNKMQALLDTMPKEVKDNFMHGRLANQDPILGNPQVIRALVSWARMINPVSTLVPNAGGDISQAIDGEIKQIETWMRAPKGSPDYKKYWDDNKTQARYRELLDGRERAKAVPPTR